MESENEQPLDLTDPKTLQRFIKAARGNMNLCIGVLAGMNLRGHVTMDLVEQIHEKLPGSGHPIEMARFILAIAFAESTEVDELKLMHKALSKDLEDFETYLKENKKDGSN